MEERINILLLEDSKMDADLLLRHLRKEKINFNCLRIWNEDDFTEQLSVFSPDLIIADYMLPQFTGLEAFQIMKEKGLRIPFILVTGSISEKIIYDLMKKGIDDYLLKDNLLRLSTIIMNVVYKKQLELEKRKVEEKNKSIMDSIYYAKRIQDAIFPAESSIKNVIPKSFVLLKPKDIISGDFFWVEKFENKTFIAAVDCTGHGVPGALLSIVGCNLLSKAISEQNYNNPGEILNALSDGIYEILQHTASRPGIKDTMDISLCSIDNKTNTLEYAGAYNPLYLVRNKKLTEICADRFPIGVSWDGEVKKFNNHKIQLEKGDNIYLFSDGYADQFGGKEGKKLKYKKFKELLCSMQTMPIDKQSQVLESILEEWKDSSDQEQTDDILVIGINI